MRLTDLRPEWARCGGEGTFQQNAAGDYEPAPERVGIGVSFDCPCGSDYGKTWEGRCTVLFNNPLDGGGRFDSHAYWTRSGETFETLTLTPSIQRRKVNGHGCCEWHGYITDGEVVPV